MRPVPFDRLLSVAVLTPAQASLVAVQLIDAAEGDTVAGDQPTEGRLGPVVLTPSGVVEAQAAHDAAATPVSELLRQLLHNARRLPAHPRHEQLLLLHHLEAAAEDPWHQPDMRARVLETALVDTLGLRARQRLSAQLAALADAFSYVAPSVPAPADGLPAPGTVGATAPPGATTSAALASSGSAAHLPHRAATARRVPGRTPPRNRAAQPHRSRGRRVALIAVLLAAVLATTGYALLSNPGDEVVRSPGRGNAGGPHKNDSGHSTKHAAKHSRADHPQAVPTLAARHSGPVTGVAVHKTGSCDAGALCPVKVTVHFRAASTIQPVTWRVGAARLCKRDVTWSTPITVMAQPGWTTVYANSSVSVPKGRSFALTAVTTTPARAQSPPVPVTGSSERC